MTSRRPWAGTLALGALAIVPPVVERAWTSTPAVARTCGAAEAVCGSIEAIEVTGVGIRLQGVRAEGRGRTVQADEITIQPAWTGIVVTLHGVQLDRAAPAEATSRAPAARAAGGTSPQPASAPPVWEAIGRALRGVPLEVAIPETLTWNTGDARIRMHRTRASWDAQGGFEVHAEVDVRHGGTWGSSVGAVRIRPLQDAWSLTGTVALGGRSTVQIEAIGRPDAFQAHVRALEGGRLDVQRNRDAWRLDADTFPLAGLGPVGPAGLDLGDATFSGAATFRRDDGAAIEVQDARLQGVQMRDRRLAAAPVAFAPIGFTGSLRWDGARHAAASGTLRYGRASTDLRVERRADRWTVDAELAPLPCQHLWDDLPAAWTDAIPGVELAGEIAGHVRVDVSFPLSETTDPALDLAFPVLERCRVTREPSTIDFAALAGPYRLSFVDGLGRARVRTLAPGAPGYRPLAAVPRVAAAFIALEDAKFWAHDGFDREQIERALWHNLRERRISRGASTITQQAARSLFLGIDRSVARKLQEAFLASRLEAHLTKARILEMYLNVIELAPGVHGVEDAARFYFGRPADELDVLEALHLAAMAPAPHRSSERFASGEVDAAWLAELRRHARRMARHGALGPDELARALYAPVRLLARAPASETP